MKNKYEVRGDITAIFIDSPKYGRKETIISTSKLEMVKDFPNRWYVFFDKTVQSFYVQGSLPRKNGVKKAILIHRFITNAPDGMKVDHRNHDTVDNTDDNLRIVTNAENLQNRKGATASSISGIRGVHWHKASNKWMARIGKKHLGLFNDIQEAEKVVTEARLKYMPFSNDALL